jgi:pimeloyl-ACP methyl ester carboxylesterase
MKTKVLWLALLLGSPAASIRAQEPAKSPPYTVQFVTVENDVKLEVVDWGGSGRPLVFLGALGADAHAFDNVAPKLTPKYHVYGLTRRGFGASSSPASGYSSERLGDDVLTVIDSLKLDRPVLVGHSMAGSELSSVGSRHPEKIAGLIYLEAGYSYAYYDESSGDTMNLILDSIEMRKKLEQLLPGGGRPDQKRLTEELLSGVAQLEKELRDRQTLLKGMPEPPEGAAQQPRPAVPVPIKGIFGGLRKYRMLPVPILAIYAVPHALNDLGDGEALAKDPAAAAKVEAEDIARSGTQANAFEKGVPSAHVVRLAHASHVIFESNEADVLREMNTFLGSLP